MENFIQYSHICLDQDSVFIETEISISLRCTQSPLLDALLYEVIEHEGVEILNGMSGDFDSALLHSITLQLTHHLIVTMLIYELIEHEVVEVPNGVSEISMPFR
jgi:hypothetical protein